MIGSGEINGNQKGATESLPDDGQSSRWLLALEQTFCRGERARLLRASLSPFSLQVFTVPLAKCCTRIIRTLKEVEQVLFWRRRGAYLLVRE